MARKKKRRGHWCWTCNRVLANERFSGGGHARHICRQCQKLPAEELAYRQNLRNLERCITAEGIMPRKRRKQFDKFLNHQDPRIRQIAQEMLAEDQEARSLQRMLAGNNECDDGVADYDNDALYEADSETIEGLESPTESAEIDMAFSSEVEPGELARENADGRRLVKEILKEAQQARADQVDLEYVSEGLEVTFMFGNAGIGSVLVDREQYRHIIRFIWDSAKLDDRDRGQFPMELKGCLHTIRVERYDLFGENAFRLRLKRAKKAQ